MKRFCHILRGNKGTQQPNNCIWFDTETNWTTAPNGKEYHSLWFGWAAFQRREAGEEWREPQWFRFTDKQAFWDWVIAHTRDKTRLYIFSHNGGFDLPVVDAFLILPSLGFELKQAIADAPPLVLTWRRGSRVIKFVDTLNIWRMSLARIGESIGKPKIDMPPKSASRRAWDTYGKQDTEIIRVAVIEWLAFLRRNDLGGFAPTVASQAFNAYRHRFMDTKIFMHDRERAFLIERESYLGGRTECFKMGKYSGEFYYIDVNSMYPAVMFNGEFPNKLLGTYDDVEFKELEKWLITKAVICRVNLRTTEPVYPIVKDDRLIFPVGRFSCTLAGPDLLYALTAGHIESIGTANVYTRAPLFKSFIAFMYDKRLEAKAEGNKINSSLFKLVMNSFYGKWGQRGRRYIDIGPCDIDDLWVEEYYDWETDKVTKVRHFGGLEQEWVDEGESRESFPGIAAYITSYARQKLWQAIKLAGRDNCYYCDTDSIVVNRAGYNALAHLIDADTLGFWKLEKRLTSLDIRGPKDYTFDTVKKVKGIRPTADWLTDDIAEQTMFVGMKGLMRDYNLSAPVTFKILKVQSRQYRKGIITDSGDVLPLTLPG